MTGAVLSALNGVDEEYLSSYENRKLAKTAYLKNRKVLVAAAALVICAAIGAIFTAVNKSGIDKGFVRTSYESFEDFVKKAASPPDGPPYFMLEADDLLPILFSDLAPEAYDTFEFYGICKSSVGNLGARGPEIFVVKLVKEGITCEIAYQPNANDSSAMPDRFRTETPYSESVVIDGVSVAYRERKKLTEGEFTADSGYYKVICYSDLFSDFSGFVTELLN
ncbi:MAG: hypothetical protein K6G71_09610 [Clostridiales bacterium]|nr:hypothetical protein [Clostridiales bacterium]